MPDVKYQRDTQRFECLGIDLNRPVDSVKPARFPYLKNCRSFLAGRIEPRDGITDIAEVIAGVGPVHSCRRLNYGNTFQRIVGTGTRLAAGQTSFTPIDSGYSGNPLALVPWKPGGSPVPYMYVADSARMRKIRTDQTLDLMGYPPPPNAPTVALMDLPKYKIVDALDDPTGWTQGQTAGAPVALHTVSPFSYRTDATIPAEGIIYDGVTSSTAGWCCVVLTSMIGVAVGEMLTFDPGGSNEEKHIVVQEVFPSAAVTSIASIVYDSGSNGPCSLYLTAPVDLAQVNGVLFCVNQVESARILAVVSGPDGTTSIRVSTVNTWVAGNSVGLQQSIRCFTLANHVVGETVRIDAVRSAITTGTGTLTKVQSPDLDLSLFASDVASQQDDLMVISVRIDDPSKLTELRVMLDVDSAGSGAGTVFTQNFYYRAFRPSDITLSVMSLQSTLSNRQTVIQNQIIDGSIPEPSPDTSQLLSVTTPSTSDTAVSQQMETGQTVWNALGFRLSDLIRVGTDDSRSLRNVNSIRIQAVVTGNVTLDLNDWYIGGAYGPDTFDPTTSPYFYRYRARNPDTNVRSNPSPATRLPLKPLRQRLLVVPDLYMFPAGITVDPATMVLDIERFGGSIADWHYVATIPNGGIFEDAVADLTVSGNPTGDITDYQPWPILGVSVRGTLANVAGTTVVDSGTSFNLLWAMGTRIIINNLPFTIYRVISTSQLELVENAGNLTNVPWQIPEPTILAQPLACLWEQNDTFFACADPVNPGRLYWSNPGSETTTPGNWIDVTSPSEPLMNGLSYNIRSYLFSSENFFQILSTNSFAAIAENSSLAQSPVAFEAQKIPNGKGLFSRWGLTREPAPIIAFLAKDGINATTGGSPIALTDADMYELFPNEGNLGVDTNGISAPQITAANAANLRLAYYDEYLYFDYRTAGMGMETLVLAFDVGAAVRGEAPGGWFWDVYTPNAQFHYGEEGAGIHSLLIGGTNTHLYQYAGFNDAGLPFSMEITTPSRDQGDPRSNKLYGDVMLDMNSSGVSVQATIFFNNNSFSNPPIHVSTASRAQLPIPCGTLWVTAKNISINLIALITGSARPFFYIWEPRWTFESAPISAFSWQFSPSSFGMENFKSIGICKVSHVSTTDISLIFTVDGVPQVPLVIPNSGGVYTQTIFRAPVYKGKLYSASIISTAEWRLDTRDSFFEVKDWASDGEYQKLRLFGDFSMIEG